MAALARWQCCDFSPTQNRRLAAAAVFNGAPFYLTHCQGEIPARGNNKYEDHQGIGIGEEETINIQI